MSSVSRDINVENLTSLSTLIHYYIIFPTLLYLFVTCMTPAILYFQFLPKNSTRAQ